MAQIKLTREQTKALAHFLQFGHWPLYTTTKATAASERMRLGMLRRLVALGLVVNTGTIGQQIRSPEEIGKPVPEFILTPAGRARAQSILENRARCGFVS